ncbi:concanavalin A-like lectin/glucanase domain-containing protein [Mrakia frigida]|uniref:concanavalin A-like lectin/glucanase domain-containing protein n=1 Tax=Mrakia frigida TaxID=29902 RepID=UPI003FCBFBD0
MVQTLGKKLSAITSVPASWSWTYTSASSDLVADVSYDLWLGTDLISKSKFEIMIWLSARGGALPAGSKISTVSIGGYSWSLYQGVVDTWTVYSFVTNSGEITNFKNDLKLFITYLTTNKGVSTSLLLTGVQAGTEPFSGSATLTTTSFRAAIAA